RGVKVLAVLDKSNETQKYSAATFLVNVGTQILIDDQHPIAHNKVIVIDSVGGHRGAKGAQTSLQWEGKPTVPTSPWGSRSSRLSGSPRPPGEAAMAAVRSPAPWRS